MRCPSCGATNPDSAAFCGQCHDRFTPMGVASAPAAPTPPAVPPGEGADVPWLAQIDAGAPPQASPAGEGRATVGRFSADGGHLTWTCATCATPHPFGVFTCPACGTRMDAEATSTGEVVDWSQARRLEAVVPGLGHLRSGHTGMGAARSAIAATWLVGSLLLAGEGVSGLLTASPLVLGMVVIWVTGPADLDAAAKGRAPRLDARRFMYLVVAATVGVIVAGGMTVLR